jgi:hypothetical protein
MRARRGTWGAALGVLIHVACASLSFGVLRTTVPAGSVGGWEWRNLWQSSSTGCNAVSATKTLLERVTVTGCLCRNLPERAPPSSERLLSSATEQQDRNHGRQV